MWGTAAVIYASAKMAMNFNGFPNVIKHYRPLAEKYQMSIFFLNIPVLWIEEYKGYWEMIRDQLLRLLVKCPIKFRKQYEGLYSILLAYKNGIESMLSWERMAKHIYCNMKMFPLL